MKKLKVLVFTLLVNSAIAQTDSAYHSSFKIENVDQKSFVFHSFDDEVTLSIKSKSFTRTNGEIFKLSKSKGKVFLSVGSDTVAVKNKGHIYSLANTENIQYYIKGRSLTVRNEKALEGHIRFKGKEVQVSVEQISPDVEKGVIYLFLYKLLTEAKIINESNLFTTGTLPGLL